MSVSAAHGSPQALPERLSVSDSALHQLLTSSDPRQQAWGAWIAGTEDRAEMAPLVQQIVSRYTPPATWFEEAARDAALDALIQLPSEPAVELVVALLAVRPTQALILLSKLPSGGDAELLDLLARETRDEWYAAANILVKRRTKGTARVMLNRLSLTVSVAVRLPGQESGLGPPCSGRFRLGCRLDESQTCSGGPEGFPPDVTYSIERAGSTGAVMLSNFLVPVFYRRSVGILCQPERREDANERCRIDPTEHLVALAGRLPPSLAHLWGIGSSPQLPVPAGVHRCVTWYGQDKFDAEIDHFRNEAAQGYADLVAALLGAVALTSAEAAPLKPRIRIDARDRNGDPVRYNTRP